MTILFGAPVFMPGDGSAGPGEAHGSDSTDFEALAAKHVAKGYSAAYAPKPAQGDRAAVRAARQAFENAGVRIAEVGCWTNLLVDDREMREANFRLMEQALAHADELRAGCTIATVGSVRAEGPDHQDPRNYSPEAFNRTVDTARRLIDSVKPKYTKLSFEALPFDFTDTPTGMRRLMDAIDRSEFAVHVDLVNWLLTSPRRYWDQHAVIREIVDQLGPWIVGAHCKDLKMKIGYEPITVEIPIGHGHVDLRAYLQALNSLDHDVTLLLEHLPSEAVYEAAAAHVRAEASAVGVKLASPKESEART